MNELHVLPIGAFVVTAGTGAWVHGAFVTIGAWVTGACVTGACVTGACVTTGATTGAFVVICVKEIIDISSIL